MDKLRRTYVSLTCVLSSFIKTTAFCKSLAVKTTPFHRNSIVDRLKIHGGYEANTSATAVNHIF